MSFLRKKILVVVKTYPNPSTKYQETVCVAGVSLESPPTLVRLYPIPFRDLPFDQQFQKYQVIEAELKKNKNDYRPESYKVNPDSIKTLEKIDTKEKWRKRKEILFPLLDSSMCSIQAGQGESKKSLGIFRPSKVQDFIVEHVKEKDWNQSQKEILSQKNFLNRNKKILEKIPYKFKVKYLCDQSGCPGHMQGLIDWETAQLYRNLRKKYDERTMIEKMKEKYLSQICGSDNDPYLIVGNQFESPKSFLILSIFYPPKETQISLFPCLD